MKMWLLIVIKELDEIEFYVDYYKSSLTIKELKDIIESIKGFKSDFQELKYDS